MADEEGKKGKPGQDAKGSTGGAGGAGGQGGEGKETGGVGGQGGTGGTSGRNDSAVPHTRADYLLVIVGAAVAGAASTVVMAIAIILYVLGIGGG